MKQHLGRQSGVQKVDVNLIDGKVDVTPKEDGQIDPAQLLKAVYDSGVTVAEMDLVARAVEPLADSPAVVTIRGELYRKPAGKKKAAASAPLKLLILEVQKKE